jgi:GNAT superfamily N-acetyltransferase
VYDAVHGIHDVCISDLGMVAIRLATEQDVDHIMNIVHKVIPIMHSSGNFQWDEKYPNPEVFLMDIMNQDLWVGEIDGVIVGMVALTLDQPKEYAHVGLDQSEVSIVPHRMAVDPDSQGKGVAKKLLSQADVVARTKGVPRVRIDTNVHNQITNRLFPSSGYILKGEIGLDTRPGLRFLCYEKLIDL